MNQLATQNDFEKNIMEIENTKKLCQMLLQTKHYAALGEAGIYAVISKAKAMNIDPIEALNGSIYFVQGKCGLSTEMMASLIRQAGHSIKKDEKSNDSMCILHGKRKDNGDTWTIKFSIEDAKKAGIYRNMWEKYPGTMCYNRAMSMLARQLFPDVIKGCGYDREELQEIASGKQTIEIHEIDDVKPVYTKPEVSEEQAEELAEIMAGCDTKYISSVWNTLAKMNPPITKFEDLTLDLYEKIKKAAQIKAKEYKDKIDADTAIAAHQKEKEEEFKQDLFEEES